MSELRLTYPLRRLLLHIERNPGLSRAELAKALYVEMNPHYSNPKVSKMVKVLEAKGLVELGVIHEGGRFGVPGVYRVGQKRVVPHLGVFGRKPNSPFGWGFE